MICEAHDDGRFAANPEQLRASIFPYFDIPVPEMTEMCRELAKVGLIRLYQVNGAAYGVILRWDDQDSQFIESRRFSTEEIARIFGVPPYMIGADTKGSLTYSNSETQALNLLKFCIGPWLARIESAVNFACISPLERRQMYVEFLSDALLATDTTARYAAYKTGIEAGFLTIDEVRRKENLPALPERVPTVG